MLKLLLREEADPHICSYTDDHTQEGLLEVSARWRAKDVFYYLMEAVDWSEKELQQALKNDGVEDEYRLTLREYKLNKFGGCLLRCICLFNCRRLNNS